MTPLGAVEPASIRTPGHPSSTASSADCASSLARWIPTQAWGPWAKARCEREFGRDEVEPVGVGERRRVAIGGRERDDDEVALPDRGARQLHIGRRVAVDPPGRRLQAERFLHGVGDQRAIGTYGGHLVGLAEQVPEQRRGHALAGLDAAEHHHRGVGDDLRRREGRRRVGEHAPAVLDRAAPRGRSAHSRRHGRAEPISPPADTRSTAATISSYQPSTTPGATSRRSSALATTRTARGPARSRRISARPAGASPCDEPARLPLHPLGESAPSLRAGGRPGRTDRDAVGARRRRATACSARRPARSRSEGRRP